MIEVVLALAVISIGLIAVVGLIPQGLQASRDAADNTLAATIVHDMFNQMRQQASIPGTAFPPAWSGLYPNYPDIYYDAAGTNQITNPFLPASLPNCYYHVHFATAVSTPNLVTVAATVTWPDRPGSVTAFNSNFFFTSIANYQN